MPGGFFPLPVSLAGRQYVTVHGCRKTDWKRVIPVFCDAWCSLEIWRLLRRPRNFLPSWKWKIYRCCNLFYSSLGKQNLVLPDLVGTRQTRQHHFTHIHTHTHTHTHWFFKLPFNIIFFSAVTCSEVVLTGKNVFSEWIFGLISDHCTFLNLLRPKRILVLLFRLR